MEMSYGEYCNRLKSLIICGRETYFVTDGELDDQEFFKDNSVVEGAVFANHLKTNQYYTIFVELQAYPFGQAVDLVQTYEEFVDSDCELVLLLADSSYVSIYCKDRNVIEKLFINALKRTTLKRFNL